MKLEEQVVSLELARQLKELGVKQESLFYWCEQDRMFADPLWVIKNKINSEVGNRQILSAFTVAELGGLLPRCYMSWATPQNGEMKWWCHRMEHHFVTHEETPTFTAETEADARAKMLMHITAHKTPT
jgi:hypothetical protein